VQFVVAAVLIGVLPHPTVRAQVTPYTFYQINPGFSPAMDVNDDGTVVGWTSNPTVGFAGYLWRTSSGFEPLTDPSILGKFPRYTAVNDPALRISGTGMIAGVGCPQGCGVSGTKAAIWNASQGLVFLGSFDNNTQTSAAAGVNSTDQVVGYSWGGGYNNFGPFIWSATDGLQHLTGFDGLNGSAMGINNNGVVVGAKGAGSRNIAFVWSAAAGQEDIPDLPGATTSDGLAINDFGVVVGRYLEADNTTYRVFRWSAASGTEDLNAPAGFPELMDINNAGDIVVTIDQNVGRVPYLYRNGIWTNLNDLLPSGTGFRLQFVEAINNKGWIVGAGTTDPNGAELLQGFVIIPLNRAPVATNGPLSTLEDTSKTGTLTASDADGDSLTYGVVTNGDVPVAVEN
jgi:Bacterial cadherin-like domain